MYTYTSSQELCYFEAHEGKVVQKSKIIVVSWLRALQGPGYGWSYPQSRTLDVWGGLESKQQRNGAQQIMF